MKIGRERLLCSAVKKDKKKKRSESEQKETDRGEKPKGNGRGFFSLFPKFRVRFPFPAGPSEKGARQKQLYGVSEAVEYAAPPPEEAAAPRQSAPTKKQESLKILAVSAPLFAENIPEKAERTNVQTTAAAAQITPLFKFFCLPPLFIHLAPPDIFLPPRCCSRRNGREPLPAKRAFARNSRVPRADCRRSFVASFHNGDREGEWRKAEISYTGRAGGKRAPPKKPAPPIFRNT